MDIRKYLDVMKTTTSSYLEYLKREDNVFRKTLQQCIESSTRESDILELEREALDLLLRILRDTDKVYNAVYKPISSKITEHLKQYIANNRGLLDYFRFKKDVREYEVVIAPLVYIYANPPKLHSVFSAMSEMYNGFTRLLLVNDCALRLEEDRSYVSFMFKAVYVTDADSLLSILTAFFNLMLTYSYDRSNINNVYNEIKNKILVGEEKVMDELVKFVNSFTDDLLVSMYPLGIFNLQASSILLHTLATVNVLEDMLYSGADKDRCGCYQRLIEEGYNIFSAYHKLYDHIRNYVYKLRYDNRYI